MIEKIVFDYLSLDTTLHPYTQIPSTLPSKYNLIDKTGGRLIDRAIKSATIVIYSYADSLFKASSLNEYVIDYMMGIVSLDEIISCELENSQHFPDPQSKKHRYKAVFQIRYY